MLNCGRRNFSIICLTQYFQKSTIEQLSYLQAFSASFQIKFPLEPIMLYLRNFKIAPKLHQIQELLGHRYYKYHCEVLTQRIFFSKATFF